MNPTQKPCAPCGIAQDDDELYILEVFRAAPDELKEVFRALAHTGVNDYDLKINIPGEKPDDGAKH